MNPHLMHDLVRDHQATLLAEAARDRLAHGGRSFDRDDGPSLAGRLASALRGRLTRAGRTRRTAAHPRSA